SPILLAACDDLVALDQGRVALAGPSKEILPRLFGQQPMAPLDDLKPEGGKPEAKGAPGGQAKDGGKPAPAPGPAPQAPAATAAPQAPAPGPTAPAAAAASAPAQPSAPAKPAPAAPAPAKPAPAGGMPDMAAILANAA